MNERVIQELIDKMKRREPEALMELYDCYAPPLFGFIKRCKIGDDESERILQSLFLRTWQEIDNYNNQNLRFFTWMFQLAKTEILKSGGEWMPPFFSAQKVPKGTPHLIALNKLLAPIH